SLSRVSRFRAPLYEDAISSLAKELGILERAENHATHLRLQARQPRSVADRKLCAWDFEKCALQALHRLFHSQCTDHSRLLDEVERASAIHVPDARAGQASHLVRWEQEEPLCRLQVLIVRA